MKNITLALAIALGFCATKAEAQEQNVRQRPNLVDGRMKLERKLPDNLRAKMTSEEIQEYNLWSNWPKEVFWYNPNIVMMCEEENKVVFYGAVNKTNNSEWTRGCGKCLIELRNSGLIQPRYDRWRKFDSDGILVWAGSFEKVAEYIWMTNRANCVTIENRKKWAIEHGMSYEDAVLKRKAYFDTLQARKEVMEAEEKRMAEAEAAKAAAEEKARIAEEREKERAQREKEREEQRAKLLQMQEELQKQREAADKAKEEE